MEPLYSPQSRAERLIAGGRVILAASSLFAVWLDPTEPAKNAGIAYSLLVCYLGYAAIIATIVWRSDAPSNRQRLVTHCFDLAFFSLFIYFTAGPASPFTAYFVFSLVCATLRWQWRGTLWTAVVSIAVYLAAGLYFTVIVADPAFQIYPLIVRAVYLAVTAVLLGYLGAHEEQTRQDLGRVAAWPQEESQRIEPLVRSLLEHAAQALGAPRAVLAWVEREEPWLYVASWAGDALTWSRSSPEAFGTLVAAPLESASFLCPDAADSRCSVLYRSAAGFARWRGAPLDAELQRRFGLQTVLSVPIAAESLEGRLFLAEKPSMTSDDLLLGEIVAGVIATRLDRFYVNQRLQETVATEERLRMARDLHDGVLQSLTGIGLRLAAVRGMLDNPRAAREAVETLQELIAREQRDLRFFIKELKPPPLGRAGEALSLGASVTELVRRIEQEWGLRAELRMQGLEGPIPEPLARDVYHVVREALVNAVRHGEASAVRVQITRGDDGDALSIIVADNGRGFPFEGRYSYDDLLRAQLGPRTLKERIASLRGTLAIETGPSGARLDIAIPCAEGGL